jgi:hypothetical protein
MEQWRAGAAAVCMLAATADCMAETFIAGGGAHFAGGRLSSSGGIWRGLLAFTDPGFNVLALGALEREQFKARAVRLNAKQQHRRSAF